MTHVGIDAAVEFLVEAPLSATRRENDDYQPEQQGSAKATP
jgi:hypothetical protein